MAKIRILRTEIEKYLKLDSEMISKINMFGTPIEEQENELEIEIFPNRPDLLSIHGLVRAINTYTGKNKGLKKYKVNPPEKRSLVKIDKRVKAIRPYAVCAIIKGLSLDESKLKEIISLQEKLHATIGRKREKVAIGIYPLDKISFPITYTSKKPSEIKFIPLGEKKEMTSTQILRSHKTGIEYGKILDKSEEYPLFVDSTGKILSMPPIINSESIGKVSESTKNLFIECSGTDISYLEKTLNILVTTLAEMGGSIFQVEISDGNKILTPNLSPSKVKISLENTNKLLGLNLKEKDLENLLPLMGYEYKKGYVTVPAWRIDILSEVDLIEDVAIAYGYDKITPDYTQIGSIGEMNKNSSLKRRISETLIGLGLEEISSLHLIKKEEALLMKLKRPIEVENSKTEYKILRPNLLIPTLRTLSENKDNEYPQNTFEIGKIFKTDEKSETGISEQTNLIISLCPGNFTQAKQHLEAIKKALNFGYVLEDSSREGFIEGRTGAIMLEGKKIGYIGEINPNILREWGIKMPVSSIEINLTELLNKI